MENKHKYGYWIKIDSGYGWWEIPTKEEKLADPILEDVETMMKGLSVKRPKDVDKVNES